jgi:hypothetical protein
MTEKETQDWRKNGRHHGNSYSTRGWAVYVGTPLEEYQAALKAGITDPACGMPQYDDIAIFLGLDLEMLNTDGPTRPITTSSRALLPHNFRIRLSQNYPFTPHAKI